MSARLLRTSLAHLRCCHVSKLARNGWICCDRISLGTGRSFISTIESRSRISYYSSLATEFKTDPKPVRLSNDLDDTEKAHRILESLKIDSQSKSRVLPQAVEGYLRLSEEEKLDNENLILLLNCCCSYLPHVSLEQRRTWFEKIWTRRPLNVDINSKIAYLHACRTFGTKFEVSEFQEEAMGNPELLQTVLYTLADQGELTQITKLIADVQARDISLTEPILASLVRVNSIVSKPENINAVLETMSALKIEQTGVTVSELVENHIRCSQEKEALALVNEKGALLNTDQLIKIIELTIDRELSKELIATTLKVLPKDVINDREIHSELRNLCSRLIHKNKFREIRSIISLLPSTMFQVNEDIDTYADFLLNELVALPAPLDEILLTTSQLIEEERNERALHIVTGSAQRINLKLFNELLPHLKEKEPLRTHYFWPSLISAGEYKGETGILGVIRQMSQLGVEVDADTLAFYVLPKLVLTLKNVERGVKHLEEAGVKISALMVPLISQLLFQQRVNEAFSINHTYKAKFNGEQLIQPLLIAFHLGRRNRNSALLTAKLIRSIVEKSSDPKYDFAGHFLVELISNPKTRSDFIGIKELLSELCLQKIKISKMAAEMTLQHLSRDLTELEYADYMKSLVDKRVFLPATGIIEGRIKPPKEMNTEELECHLKELEAKNMNPRGVLRRLLQMLIREGNHERALEIKDKCDKLKVDISPGMLASIFDLYVQIKDIPKASETLRKLNHTFPGFLLDEFKVIDFAAVLVENGNIDEAQKVLRMRAGVGGIKGGLHVQKNIWNLLNNVAMISPKLDPAVKNHTYNFFNFLMKFNYCGYSNTAMGPIIKEHINRMDLKGAVQQYIELSKSHRVTPLQRQLQIILVDCVNREEEQQKYGVTLEEAQVMLRDVLSAATEVHGPANTNTALIVSLAEVGTEKQLRKMLIDPKVRISPEVLRKQCEFLNANKQIDALVKLARCSRGLNHIREQDIYDMIMNTLVQENNYETALQLFERLSADDEFKISHTFIHNLIDLLKRNNLEPPTSVTLYAK